MDRPCWYGSHRGDDGVSPDSQGLVDLAGLPAVAARLQDPVPAVRLAFTHIMATVLLAARCGVFFSSLSLPLSLSHFLTRSLTYSRSLALKQSLLSNLACFFDPARTLPRLLPSPADAETMASGLARGAESLAEAGRACAYLLLGLLCAAEKGPPFSCWTRVFALPAWRG